MKVIGIRATNGGGKTRTARELMKITDDTFIKKYKLSNGVLVNVYQKYVILGSYDRACGGCDTVSKPGLVWDAIVECAEYSNVVFEGIIVGCVYQPTIDLVERLKPIGATYIPICLDTSFEQSVENVNSRRAIEGKPPIEKTDNIMINYKKHLSSAKKLKADGLRPYWVSSDEAVQIILKEIDHKS
jgi:hypothetical protein